MTLLVSEDLLARFTLAAGFSSATTACGLKKSGALDLAMVWSDARVNAEHST